MYVILEYNFSENIFNQFRDFLTQKAGLSM